jgi:hypothetical protein
MPRPGAQTPAAASVWGIIMATLPLDPLATGSVDIAGNEVPIRSLSRPEGIRLQTFQGHEDDAEAYIVAASTGVTDDEARAWLAAVSIETGGRMVDAILQLSGLMDPRAGSTRGRPNRRSSSEP